MAKRKAKIANLTSYAIFHHGIAECGRPEFEQRQFDLRTGAPQGAP
jgi:hypothetical protein